MSATKITIDDFWKDCLTDPYSKPIISSKKLNANRKNKKQNFNRVYTDTKSLYISKMKNSSDSSNNSRLALKQISSKNRKNIKEALIKEEIIPLIKKKRREKSIQKCLEIYNKDKISKEQLYKNNAEQKMKKDNLKVEQCTFKPQKFSNRRFDKKINRIFNGMNIYERNVKFTQQHKEKVAFLLNEISKVNNSYKSSQCVFQPIILNTNIDKILYNENNIWKEQADNDSNKLFLLRYIKARDEEFYKKEKLNNSVNRKLKNSLTNQKRMTRSISQKDSLMMQKNLHNVLYSLSNLLVDEDDDEDELLNFNEEKKKFEEKNNIQKSFSNLQWTFSKKFE